MNKKSVFYTLILIACAVLVNWVVLTRPTDISDQNQQLQITMKSDDQTAVTVSYLQEEKSGKPNFANAISSSQAYTDEGKYQKLSFEIPVDATDARIRFADHAVTVDVKSITLQYRTTKLDDLRVTEKEAGNSDGIAIDNDGIRVLSSDSYIQYRLNMEKTVNIVRNTLHTRDVVKNILLCIAFDLVLFFVWLKRRSISEIPKDIVKNRKLIANLAKNDFKQKFAGSYLGVIWAFVQPIVTVFVYWFVFEKALNAGAQSTKAGITVPYVLWLIAGLVPWFYFSEVLNSGTSVLSEYSYLVKKVVFDINVLPVVKVISSLFVHLFFIGFTLVMYCFYQYWPTLYMLQMLYYSFAMIILTLGLVYITSAVMVFFRDLSQVINIVLQIGIWMTPIMWNIDAMGSHIPGWVLVILKLNPMYYIVCGYRDSLISGVWFWQRMDLTIYYWCFTLLVFVGGITLFKRLQPHFADVL